MKFKAINSAALIPHADRFRAKLRLSNECHVWTGALKDNGYGSFRVSACEGMVHAHRAAWMLEFGDIPPGLYVCHSCDKRSCCNPKHLWLGTASDNQRDMVAKGRQYIPFLDGHCPRGADGRFQRGT